MARLLLVYGASPGLTDSDGNAAEAWHLQMGREAVARTIRMLQSPKFALDEADQCFAIGDFWMAMRLCELGVRYYSVYDGKAVKDELQALRRMSISSVGSEESSATGSASSWQPTAGVVAGSISTLAAQASMQQAVGGHLAFGAEGTATAEMQRGTAAAVP